jgi:tight adherence protein B
MMPAHAVGSELALVLRWPSGLPRGSDVVAIVAGAVLSGVLARQAGRAEATERARALGHRRRTLLPSAVDARLAAALLTADVSIDTGAAVQIWLLAALAGGCLAVGIEPLFAPAAIAGVLIGGPVGLFAARHRGARRRTAELPVALEQVASELRTGGTVAGAIAALGRTEGPLAAEFLRIDRRCALGATLDGALGAWAVERSDPAVSSAAGALAVAAATGGRAADALDGLASSLRDRSEIAAEGRALSAQARMSAVVVGSLPVAYLAASAIFDPGQVRILTHTTFGLLCLVVGLTLEGLAGIWIRALLQQDG